MLLSNYKSDIIKVWSLLILTCFLYSPSCTHLTALQWLTEQTQSPVKHVYAWAAGIRHSGLYSSGNRRLWLDCSVHWRLSFNSTPMPWCNRTIHILGSSDTKAVSSSQVASLNCLPGEGGHLKTVLQLPVSGSARLLQEMVACANAAL